MCYGAGARHVVARQALTEDCMKQATPTERRFFTMKDFAEALGISLRHMKKLVSEGRVASVKLSSKVRRIPASELARLEAEARR